MERVTDLDSHKVSRAHSLKLWVRIAIQETDRDLGRIRERWGVGGGLPRAEAAGKEQEGSCSSSSLNVSRVGEMKWKSQRTFLYDGNFEICKICEIHLSAGLCLCLLDYALLLRSVDSTVWYCDAGCCALSIRRYDGLYFSILQMTPLFCESALTYYNFRGDADAIRIQFAPDFEY